MGSKITHLGSKLNCSDLGNLKALSHWQFFMLHDRATVDKYFFIYQHEPCTNVQRCNRCMQVLHKGVNCDQYWRIEQYNWAILSHGSNTRTIGLRHSLNKKFIEQLHCTNWKSFLQYVRAIYPIQTQPKVPNRSTALVAGTTICILLLANRYVFREIHYKHIYDRDTRRKGMCFPKPFGGLGRSSISMHGMFLCVHSTVILYFGFFIVVLVSNYYTDYSL